MNTEIKLIAHGGYSAKYPENTEQSFLEAVKYNPSIIEMDVVEHPRTGEFICFHPSGISSQFGTFSNEAVIEQLQQGHNFPRVKEMLNEIPQNIKILLDFKQPSKELFEKIINDLRSDLTRVIIAVRNMDDFSFIISLNPEVQTLALFSAPDSYVEYAQKGGKYFRLWEKDLTKQRVQAIQELGLEVWVTPGRKATELQPRTAGDVDEQKLDWLVSLAINGVLVNDIAFASKYLNS
ncbi:MAG: glycerophosphodiester phosphodiesterase [Pseudomonadales bacterium]|nr:glycerophosphodiester phosphodiesterase [Pseudomonadales bacterium]